MHPKDLRAYAQRDWSAVDRAKHVYWADRSDDLAHHVKLRDRLDRGN